MTGTSMDGIDISLVQTDGIDLKRLNKNFFYKYSDVTKDYLLDIINKDIQFNLKRKEKLDELITEEHYKAINSFDLIEHADLVGFHGQTIYHNPLKKISIQLGNPSKLARVLGKSVVFDFRSQDIALGGQGAPLAPIYHKYILESLNLELPACILNIGGVANLTYWDGKTLIGFETGSGNDLMDNYMKKIYNKYFDEDGVVASKGVPNKEIVHKFISHEFFQNPPPKSLDRSSFIHLYNELLINNFSVSDTMATLAEFTIESIIIALDYLPKKINNIIITGGGSRNKNLMKCLKTRLDLNFVNEVETGLNFDYVESELIAFLSARSFYKLPFTFPSTTGNSRESSGGKVYNYL